MKIINYGPKDRSKTHYIGVYDFTLEIVLCHDVARAYNCPSRLKRMHNKPMRSNKDPQGICSSDYRNVIVYFKRADLSHGLIAHEARHVIDAIFRYNNIRFGKKSCHETAALGQEYIHRLIYAAMKKWKAPIK